MVSRGPTPRAPNPTPYTLLAVNSIILVRSDIKTQYHLELSPTGETKLTVRQEKNKVKTDAGETLEGDYFIESTYLIDFASTIRLTRILAKAKCTVVSLD